MAAQDRDVGGLVRAMLVIGQAGPFGAEPPKL